MRAASLGPDATADGPPSGTVLSRVGRVDTLTTIKARDDYYDDVHFRKHDNAETTLCGLKVRGTKVSAEATCLKCRQFASGDF